MKPKSKTRGRVITLIVGIAVVGGRTFGFPASLWPEHYVIATMLYAALVSLIAEGAYALGARLLPHKKAATVAGLIVAAVVMFTSTMTMARDKGDWFDVQVTGVDSNKIGERHTSSRWSRHHDSVAIEGHMVTVHANGKIYEVSSPKEMVELGRYRALLVNHGRDMRIRYEDHGRREDATFRIDSVSLDAPTPAPVSAENKKLEWEDMTMQKAAQADPQKFVIRPDPASPLDVCIETLTLRDGSQTCLHYAGKK